MELDPLVDVEDQLTLVLSLQKSGDVCVYLGTRCLYMSLIWGLWILELGFLFQSSNDHVGSVPGPGVLLLEKSCDWGKNTGMLRYLYTPHDMLKQIHDLQAMCILPHVTWFKDRTCTTTSTKTCNVSSFCFCAARNWNTWNAVWVSGHRPHRFQDVEDFRSLQASQALRGPKRSVLIRKQTPMLKLKNILYK